jgi:Outer membrane lipoprotein-sorting protein
MPLLVAAALASPSTAQAQGFAVAPAALADVEGNLNNQFPFDPTPAGSSVRYQQVFAADEFAGLLAPLTISAIAFRPDSTAAGPSGLSGSLSDLRIHLSTTDRGPDALSSDFATNVGPDDQLVFQGSLAFTPTTAQPPGPAPFDIVVPLDAPFSYDPASGHLLLDIRNASTGASGLVDAEGTLGDGTSRALAYDVASPTANAVDSLGLVVRFTLPEPAPAALAGAALAVLLLLGLAAPAVRSDPTPETAREIEDCARATLPRDSSIQTVFLSARDRAGGSRDLRARIYWKRFDDGRSRVLLRVTDPPDMRGAGLLFVEKETRNDTFLYLPALRRVRRVTTRMVSSTLFGTDLSLEDFERLQGLARGPDPTRLPDGVVRDRPVYVLEAELGNGADSAYERIVSYIDRETCVPLRVEYYEPGGRLRKAIEADPAQIVSAGGARVPRHLSATDLRDDTSTEIVVEEIEVGAPVSRHLFSARFLETGQD